jgi:hypothetical protein
MPVIRDKAYHTQGEWSELYKLLTPSLILSLMVLSSAYRPGSKLFSLEPLLKFNTSTLLLVCG